MAAFFPADPPKSARAWVAELDGRVIAVAGYYIDGGAAVVFSDMKDEMYDFPVTIVREARAFMARLPVPAACSASPRVRGAGRFLRRLGWQHLRGNVFVWNS